MSRRTRLAAGLSLLGILLLAALAVSRPGRQVANPAGVPKPEPEPRPQAVGATAPAPPQAAAEPDEPPESFWEEPGPASAVASRPQNASPAPVAKPTAAAAVAPPSLPAPATAPAIPGPEHRPEPDYVPLTVLVNGRDYGARLLRETADGLCLGPEDLRALDVPEAALPRTTPDAGCWPLPALAPDLRGELLPGTAELRLQVDARRLPAQAMNLGYSQRSEPAQFPQSAYLNYGLDLSRYDADHELIGTVPLELGLRSGRWLARSTALAQEGRFQRLYSSLQRDFPEQLSTLSLGDIGSGIGSVTGGSSLAGLQWSRNFAYQPLVQRSPGLDYGGVLDTPSTVEVYIDDRKVSSTALPAGPFNLQNLPVQAGLSGNARIEILDAFGQRRVLDLPYFLGSGLLKAGESQFSYSLGLPRAAGGGDRYQQQPAFVAAHRWGLGDQLTLGYQGLAADRLGLLGGELDVALGAYGQLGLGQFFGGDPATPGQSSRLGYRYARRRFNFDSDYSRRSANFRSLGAGTATTADGEDSWLWATRVGGSLQQINGSLSYLRGRDLQGSAERYALSLGSRLGALGSLNLQLRYDPRDAEPSLLLTFSSQLRRGPFAQLGLDSDEQRRQLSARLSRSPSGYTGTGYRVELARQQTHGDSGGRGDDTAFSADLDLRRQAYTAVLSRQQPGAGDSTRLLLAGSAVADDGGLSLAQPVRGSFLSVEVADLPDAEVYADGRRIGRTGSRRPVSIADLTPYLTHQVTVLLPDNLPIGTDLPARTQPVTLADGSGQRLRFQPRRLRLYEGHLQRTDGSLVEYAPLMIRGASVEVASTTGEAGYLYLQNLEPGAYRIEVGGSRPCQLELSLPAGADTYTSLGKLLCLTE